MNFYSKVKRLCYYCCLESMTWTRCNIGFWQASGGAQNKTQFHQHLCNNYINPPLPQFNGTTRDPPEALSNPGSAGRLLRNDRAERDNLSERLCLFPKLIVQRLHNK